MGHSDISVTLNTHTNVKFEDAKDEMCKIVNKKLVGKHINFSNIAEKNMRRYETI